ncbi:MAG TPA: tetratricopeptide repeat protein [Verrucomicrobiae bacterium]|nr:tetratricopeptide repeat protein [Verrucomicrobiae bacterium]
MTVVLVVTTFAAYQPVWRAGFIWDDDSYVTDNPALRSIGGLRDIWLNPKTTPQYYPLTFTAFWIEYHLWGLHPLGFHLVNVLLQAMNAVLFWRLLSRLKVPGAWWAAAVFAVHPVHVMSVAWITELKNVLSGFFFLTALLAYLRFCESDQKSCYALALALYLCALLSKTATSILPVAVLLILWWQRGRIGWKQLVPLLPFFVAGIVFGVFTLSIEKHLKGASGREFTLPFLERVLVAGRSFWFCLGKLLWPVRLTFVYPRWQVDPTTVLQYLYPLGAIGLLVALWRARGWIGRAALAALVYFALAFPALILVQVLYMMRYTFVADHWQYLGSMSVIGLAAGGAATALSRFRTAGFVLGTVVLVTLGVLTWQQALVYRDAETLWRDTLAKNPQCWMAHNNLGIILRRVDKNQDAIGEYEQALQLNPDYAEAHYNLGNALLQLGKTKEAMAHYQQALRLKPDDAEARNNLGLALFRVGQIQGAIEQYEAALRIKPDFAEAHDNLGLALFQAGQIEAAISQYEQAVRINPDYAEAHFNLGHALLRRGNAREAIGHLVRWLQTNPEDAKAHGELGLALMQTDKTAEAIGHLEQAMRLKPDFPEAENNLAWLLATRAPTEGGDPARAVQLAQRACERTGNRVAVNVDTLAVAYAATGRFDDAVVTAQTAIELARLAGQPQLIEEMKTRLELYRSGRAYHETGSPSP